LILSGFIPWNDIKDHREHDDKNKEEYQENLKVNNNVCNHCNDVAIRLEDLHEEESFQKAREDDNDHNDLGPDIPGSIFHGLHIDIQESKKDMTHVNVVGCVKEIRSSLFQHLSSIIDCWVKHANEYSNHVSSITKWENSWVLFIENVYLFTMNFAHFSLPPYINFIINDNMSRDNVLSYNWCEY